MIGRRGIATLVVLWAMLLLGTLALGFSLAMRTEAQAARNGLDATRAYYQARSGIDRALALLSSMPPDNVMAMKIADEEGDAAYAVSLVPESGKVDINLVGEAMLKEILGKGGLTTDQAEALGDAILDWRDADDIPLARGAEASAYANDPEPVRPRNGKLAALEELQYVKGMTPRFYDRFVAKVFTVHGGGAVNINVAPVDVLAALPGVSAELAQAIAARRDERPFSGLPDVVQFLGGTGFSPPATAMFTTVNLTPVYTIRAEGTVAGKASRTISCLAEIGGTGENPVRMIGWKDLVAGDEER